MTVISRMQVARRLVTQVALRDVDDLGRYVVSGTIVTSSLDEGFKDVRHPFQLERPFSRFHADRELAAMTVCDGELVAYGWLCTPASSWPAHLPKAAAGKYWIHYCGTVPAWRGRGLYKQTLSELCRLAWRHGGVPVTTVYIDVILANAPALSAVSSLGFVPDGRALAIYVPRVGYLFRKWWRD